jgi:hypothetical protein
MPWEKAQKTRDKSESFVRANKRLGNVLQLSPSGKVSVPFSFRERTPHAGSQPVE